MTDEREIVCDDCLDSGWCRFECTGLDCGRRRKHLPHTYAKPCPCRPMNRNYQEVQQRQRRRAA